MTPTHRLLPAMLLASQVLGFSIDTKLDLPNPSSSLIADKVPFQMDSSLSPKVVKAFYEINFVQVSKPEDRKSYVTVTDTKDCPYSKELCKSYFVPSKVSVVQKVEDFIQESKKDSSLSTDVPVIQGITVTDEEKLLKELSPRINTQIKKSKNLNSRTNKESDDVPVYRGTVNVDRVLQSPEISSLPDYRPRYPETKRQCFQGPCWRTSYK